MEIMLEIQNFDIVPMKQMIQIFNVFRNY